MIDVREAKVLVCGGRNWGELPKNFDQLPKAEQEQAERLAIIQQQALDETLMAIHEKVNIVEIIEGDARGADKWAGKWAKTNGITNTKFPADWDTHGKAAGFIRNAQMLDEGKPSLVVAFPGGNGTQDMIERAKKAGLPIFELVSEE